MTGSSLPAPHSPLRILLAGGGSGGSATPVLAVAQALRDCCPEVRFLYIGTPGGPEGALARGQNIPFKAVATGKLRRYWDIQNLVDPLRVLQGTAQAYALARRFRPRVAFAAGGFGAVPPMLAARAAGARTLIHQQDVEPGLANRLLVPIAQRITVSLPASVPHFPRKRTLVTGNPVRREILTAQPKLAFAQLGLDHETPLVVVTGGGTGALGLNTLVATAAPRLVQSVQVVHLTGRGRSVPAQTDSHRYRAYEFLIDELPHLLAAATVVVTRAGMGTLTELAALGKAAIVVPLPDSHQWANARVFAHAAAIEVANQDALTPETLSQRILGLCQDAPRREQLGRALGASMPRDAADRIAAEVLSLAF